MEHQVLSPGEIFIDDRVLHLNADKSADLLSIMLDIMSSYVSRSRCLAQESGENLDRSAFSSTVRSKKSEELAIIDLERYSFDSLGTISIGFYYVLNLDCGQLSKPLSY